MDPRKAAFEVLRGCNLRRSTVQHTIQRYLDLTTHRQCCLDLVMGVLKNRRAIDKVIRTFGGCRLDRIDKPLLDLIRIAVYELVYCPNTPVYAIVDQAVELAKSAGQGRRSGFVNAVLRSIARHILDRQITPSDESCNPRRILLTGPQTGCLFDGDILPQPNSVQYVAVAFSLPDWLAADWVKRFGYRQAVQCGLASIRRPGVYLWPNLIRSTAKDLLLRLNDAGIKATQTGQGCIRLAGAGRIDQIPGYMEGLFFVQDPGAASCLEQVDLRPGQSVLDLCAAPGGKAIQIFLHTRGQSRIVATDADPGRLGRLKENLQRLGIEGICMIEYEKLPEYVVANGPFDLVLVDAPCSNTAVLARRVEVRYRLRPADIEALVQRQMQLLHQASTYLASQGMIIYSTCSIQQQENEDLVRMFLEGHPDFCLESQRLILPDPGPVDHDGGFVAVIRSKRADVSSY